MTKHRYQWHGKDRQGRPVTGERVANHKEEVREWLQQQRIRATRIHRQFLLPPWLTLKPKQSIQTREISRFTRQLATLLQSGVPLLQAFDILNRGESSSPLKVLICDIQAQIENGVALNKACRQHPSFDALYCNLIAVGEITGRLDVVLKRLADHHEKSEALRATLRSALIYPCAVVVISVVVLALILGFVVPAFQNIFSAFGAELPWLTRAVIRLSEAVQHHGLIAAIVSISFVFWLKQQIAQRVTWQHQTHRMLLRLPIAGPLTRNACTARWTRTLATLFAAGVPLTEALESVQGVTGNLLFQFATQSIQSELMKGTSLSQALENNRDLFPSMVIQMCAIGEESGALDHMLEKTAEHYEREVEHTVMRLSTLLEPFIMVVLGLLIGGLVMALYLPIFQLGQVV